MSAGNGSDASTQDNVTGNTGGNDPENTSPQNPGANAATGGTDRGPGTNEAANSSSFEVTPEMAHEQSGDVRANNEDNG